MYRYQPSGKTVASVRQLKDGTYLEIMRDGKQRVGHSFKNLEEWYATLPENVRVNKSVVNKPPRPPIAEDLVDIPYLLAIKAKYQLRAHRPRPQMSISDKISYLTDWLKGNEERANPWPDAKQREQLATLSLVDPEVAKQKIYFLPREAALLYVFGPNELIPIGYDEKANLIVFEGKASTMFTELGLPERPSLWIIKGRKVFRAH